MTHTDSRILFSHENNLKILENISECLPLPLNKRGKEIQKQWNSAPHQGNVKPMNFHLHKRTLFMVFLRITFKICSILTLFLSILYVKYRENFINKLLTIFYTEIRNSKHKQINSQCNIQTRLEMEK